MARTSGALREALATGELRHAASRTSYRIERDGRVIASPGGERRLGAYIGSGAAGRSYLFEHDRYLFLAPVTWYAQSKRWDVSPGYERERASWWNRPVEPNCLFCHATRAQPIHGTQNRYADPPFVEPGIGCERCHGPGSEHASGAGGIVNPAKLPAARRDDICAQCHLTGEARIDLPGQRLAFYRPGGALTDYVAYFVRDPAPDLKVTSHVEKLSYSRCRQAAGEKLWCGTCHDAHGVRRVEVRARCLECHGGAHRREQDCAACHMPKARARDANHGVFTDHSIPRAPRRKAEPAGAVLRAFRGTATDRELGLAYAETGLDSAAALRLLRAAAPTDAAALTRLALLESGSEALYRRSLALDPNQPAALVNLGVLLGRAGRLDDAIALWRRALTMNPGLTEASANLAAALDAQGAREEARKVRSAAAIFAPGVVK